MGAFFGASAAGRSSSAFGAALVGGLWASIGFFLAAGDRLRQPDSLRESMSRLSRSERATARAAFRSGNVPSEEPVRSAAIAHAEWIARPDLLWKPRLWVMSGWIAVAIGLMIAHGVDGDWEHVGRSAAFGALPALTVVGVLAGRKFKEKARVLLALPEVARTEKMPEATLDPTNTSGISRNRWGFPSRR